MIIVSTFSKLCPLLYKFNLRSLWNEDYVQWFPHDINLSTFYSSSFSLIVSLLNRYNVEHVRPTKTSVKPIYIRTSTLLIAAGNITTFAT